MTSAHIKVGSAHIRRKNNKTIRHAEGSEEYARGVHISTQSDGFIEADIFVYVDVQGLADIIGYKTLRTKTGMTKLQSGTVTLVAKNVRKVQ